uniref:Uncharacterized protein n=1 Tax=Clytia hemisphaerica TaxID=252671 RepID=A0A7M5WT01_9CNID
EIPSEPLANEYNDTQLNEFLELSAINSYEASLTCPGTNPIRYNGEIWSHPTDFCIFYKCNKEAKVETSWDCYTCKDAKTGQQHRKKSKWIDSQDICLENECTGGFSSIKSRTITYVDPPLTKDDCGGLEPVKLPNECCPRCG